MQITASKMDSGRASEALVMIFEKVDLIEVEATPMKAVSADYN